MLEPIDTEQCQCLKPNGVTPFTMGGRFALVRCTNRPYVVITEAAAGEDGLIGSMSLCADCLVVFERQDARAVTRRYLRPTSDVAPVSQITRRTF